MAVCLLIVFTATCQSLTVLYLAEDHSDISLAASFAAQYSYMYMCNVVYIVFYSVLTCKKWLLCVIIVITCSYSGPLEGGKHNLHSFCRHNHHAIILNNQSDCGTDLHYLNA